MGSNNLYNARFGNYKRSSTLYDLAAWRNGLAFKNRDVTSDGIPIIKIAELNSGITSSTSFTSKRFDINLFLKRGDLLFSWSGNPDTSIDIFRFNLDNGWLNQHIFKIDVNSNLIEREFFFVLMKWLKPRFKRIASNKQTTGLGHITIEDLKKIEVSVPPVDVQKKISHIYVSIESKIAINNRINDYLAA